MRNRTSDLRISRSDALPLSHRDSTVSEVYHEVHLTRVLHTAKISNVDSVMFVIRISHTISLILFYTLMFSILWGFDCMRVSCILKFFDSVNN